MSSVGALAGQLAQLENFLSCGRMKNRGAAFGEGDGGTSMGFEFRDGSGGVPSSENGD